MQVSDKLDGKKKKSYWNFKQVTTSASKLHQMTKQVTKGSYLRKHDQNNQPSTTNFQKIQDADRTGLRPDNNSHRREREITQKQDDDNNYFK